MVVVYPKQSSPVERIDIFTITFNPCSFCDTCRSIVTLGEPKSNNASIGRSRQDYESSQKAG